MTFEGTHKPLLDQQQLHLHELILLTIFIHSSGHLSLLLHAPLPLD